MLLSSNRYSNIRGFNVFGEFSKNVKGEAERYWILHTIFIHLCSRSTSPRLFLLFLVIFFGCRNPEFHQSVKELREKAEELKGVKDELKVR